MLIYITEMAKTEIQGTILASRQPAMHDVA